MYAIYNKDNVRIIMAGNKTNGVYARKSTAEKYAFEPDWQVREVITIPKEIFTNMSERINFLETLVPEIICLDCGGNKESGMDVDDENYDSRCRCDEE